MKKLKREYFKFLVVILVVVGVTGILNALLTGFLFEKSAAIGFETDYSLVRHLLSLYGKIVNDRISDLSGELLAAHHRIESRLKKEGNPALSWLVAEKQALEKKLGGSVDIAVIDRQGVVRKTTYAAEKNLDLNKFEDVRSVLDEVARRGGARVDFPIMENEGRFYRLYTLSYLPGRKFFLQLGYRLDILDRLPALFAPRTSGRNYVLALYSVYRAGNSSCVTCVSDHRVELSAERKRVVLKALKSDGDIVSGHRRGGKFSVFRELRLGEERNWNNNREYRLVMELGLGSGTQYLLVRVSRWVNLVEIAIILLIIFFGYRKLNSLMVHPLARVSARMEEARPVDIDRLENASSEIVTIARAYNLHLENIKIRGFARDLIAAQEEERKRIARELHDSVAQDLSLALISLDMIARRYPEIGKLASDLSLSLKRGLTEIRDLIFNLDSESISRLGLVAAFEDCIERFSGQGGFEIDFTADMDAGGEPEISIANNLYRILQEALSNAARYSRAGRVAVELVRRESEIRLTVADDGVGFDRRKPPAADGRGHFGLVNMAERCRLLGGCFELHSEPGRGCRIVVTIPTGKEEG